MSTGRTRQKPTAHAQRLPTRLRSSWLVDEQLRSVDVLERALDARTADERAAVAQADVDKDAVLRARLEIEIGEREALAGRRAAMAVPAPAALVPMRRLATDLAAARGALNVGLVVTVTPTVSLSTCG